MKTLAWFGAAAVLAVTAVARIDATIAATSSSTGTAVQVAPSRAPAPKPAHHFKLKCDGAGAKGVVFMNTGSGPVPVGTVAKWQVDKTKTYPKPHSGTYTFKKALDAGMQLDHDFGKPASSGGGAGDQSEVGDVINAGGAVVALELLRPCHLQLQK